MSNNCLNRLHACRTIVSIVYKASVKPLFQSFTKRLGTIAQHSQFSHSMNSATTPTTANSLDSQASADTVKPSGTSTSSQGRPPVVRTWGVWWQKARWPTLIVSTIVLLVCAVAYSLNTTVFGTEINSHTWEVRQFSFRQDPFSKTQLTNIRYQSSLIASGAWSSTTGLASVPDPAIKSFLSAKPIQPERWDLVRLYDRYDTVGRGAILLRLVNTTVNGSKRFWIDWTSSEPTKAAILWPAAQQLVDLGLYVSLPELFDLAAIEKDNTKFQERISSLMQAVLLEHAQQNLTAGDGKFAIDVAKLGLTYGDHPALQAMVEQK